MQHVSVLQYFLQLINIRLCYVYRISSIHSSFDGHLGCFHHLTIVDSAAMYICLQVFELLFSLILAILAVPQGCHNRFVPEKLTLSQSQRLQVLSRSCCLGHALWALPFVLQGRIPSCLPQLLVTPGVLIFGAAYLRSLPSHGLPLLCLSVSNLPLPSLINHTIGFTSHPKPG